MSFEFKVQLLDIGKLFPIVKVTLVAAVAPLYLAVVPRDPWWDELVSNPLICQGFFEGTDLLVANEAVGEFGPIICLNCLDGKREGM